MKTQGKIWIIYDAEKKVQTKPMSVVQAQITLLSLSKKKRGKFFLWTPGWDKWVCIREFIESEQKYFAFSQPPKPISADTMTITDLESEDATSVSQETRYTNVSSEPSQPYLSSYHQKDFNGDELDLSKIKKIKPESKKKKNQSGKSGTFLRHGERRRDPRHNFKIAVVLVSNSRTFRTYSQDISLSGTLLGDEIPRDFLNQPFDLIIVNPFEPDPAKSRLLFRAKFVGDMADLRRLTFIEQDVDMTRQLEALLKAYTAYTEIKQKTG